MAYGLDIYQTRVYPSKQFDVLKDDYDYVLDCIDSLKDKMTLIFNASASRAVFFSSMGLPPLNDCS